ncbi:hypothetical protein SAMN06265365_11933 [Tistlia consotensis]|uniref:Uncharacterized protein n=1 Tax=Tistlia consotensis USBA 355 TaxID=560819 RepID=A0A1Y6CBH2_9PROT|nr:hypothetical protein [Tistlia consotensis]SMF55234.1 hypothetical protein SAMN05428998_12033 [Tistlia consotensis USBA 355]SNR87945.1 hypothetical protein SAMN06265365_11933 [Tistlia consotensis]
MTDQPDLRPETRPETRPEPRGETRAETRAESEQAIAAYKRILKACLDKRPSGTRQRLALALGTHKSFVSQITSPTYRVPLPAQHLPTIFRLCHFSPDERRRFLEAYRQAHPGQALPGEAAGEPGSRLLEIEIPPFDDPRRQQELVEAIRETAQRMIALAQHDKD